MIVGRRPSGTLATINPIAKLKASLGGRPATSQPIGRKARPASTATRPISHATRRTCCSSGLRVGIDTLRQRRDPAELRLHARGDDQCRRFAADTARAAEDQITCLDQWPGRAAKLRGAKDGLRLAGQRGKVDLEPAFEQTGVGRDTVSSESITTSPGTSSAAAT